jgi:phage terminase Nu1 subunit (DNA packaging protein)
MRTTLRRRLERLELQHQGLTDEVQYEAQRAALQAISDEDLNTLHAFQERGAPLSAPTEEEQAALERFSAECQAAGLRTRGQQPSRRGRRI